MKKFIEKNIQTIILWFLFLGPIFDVITAVLIHVLDISFTIGIISKILFMLLLIYDMFFISKCRYKKINSLLIGIIICYMVLFLGQVILLKGMDVFLYECQNMVRTFFFPIALIGLYNLYMEKRFIPNKKDLCKILITYLIFIFVPNLTNTSFDSYAYSKTGSIGWFNSANEVGGILSILLPFLIIYITSKKNIIIKIIAFIFIFYIYLNLGTKVPVLSLIIVISIYIGVFIIKLIKEKKWKIFYPLLVSIIILIIPIIIIIPKTSFYKNIIIHLEFLEIKSIEDLLRPENIDHFIYSERITFLEETLANYYESNLSEKLLGIGYVEKYGTDQINIKTIEMDYYDVFFRHGIIGSIIFFAPFIYLLVEIFKNIKPNIYLVSLLLILILSLFSGHILVAPSVSILVSIILIGLHNEVNT